MLKSLETESQQFFKFQIPKKQWDFSDLFPYGVMGDQQGLINWYQYDLKEWIQA